MEKNEHHALRSPSGEDEGEDATRGEWVLIQKHPLFSSNTRSGEDEGEDATRGEWVPIQKHPLFSSNTSSGASCPPDVRLPSNLMAWDGSSRLYLWDSTNCCLHRLSLRFVDPEPDSIYASSSSKVPFLSSSYSIALLGFDLLPFD